MADSDTVRGSRGGGSDEDKPQRTSLVTFYRQVVAELRKVVWPTQDETVRTTIVILIVVVIVSLILAGFDWVISLGVRALLGQGDAA